MRVLKAARDAKVKRVVLTSTCGAIYYGHPQTSWTDIHGEMSAYVRSMAIAERAAWDFMAAEGEPRRQSLRHLRAGSSFSGLLAATARQPPC